MSALVVLHLVVLGAAQAAGAAAVNPAARPPAAMSSGAPGTPGMQGTPQGSATAVDRVCAAAIDELLGHVAAPESRVLAIAVSSPETPELARAAQTCLASAAAQKSFKSVLPLRGPAEAAEEAARQAGADLLLRLTARICGADLTLAGDWLPTWVNFWAGQDPVRAAGGGAIAARATSDAQALALAHLPIPRTPEGPARGEIATRFALRTLARLPERIVALSVGDYDGDRLGGEIAALGSAHLYLLEPNGQIIARRDLGALPRSARPPREPAGALASEAAAVEGAGLRIVAFSFARARGETLELHGGELRPVPGAVVEAPTACAGQAGALQGQVQPGRNLLAPELRLGARAAALPFAPVAVAANPRAGTPAFVAVGPDGSASALDAELKVTELALGRPLGAAVALGDLDGDGASELVATSFARNDDRARLLRPDGRGGFSPSPLFESEALPVNLAAAAAGDLLGEGRDEAVLAGWAADGSTTLYVLGAQR